MKNYRTALLSGLVVAGFMGCPGCKDETLSAEATPKPVDIFRPYDKERRTTSSSGMALALGDIDLDGLNDLVIGSPTSVTYLHNTGNGRFQEKQIVCSPYDEGRSTFSHSGIAVALGDLDDDGDLDLVVGHPTFIRAYINNEGVFEPQVE